MTKQELEKAIENGESVWVSNKYCYPYEVNLTKNHYIDMADNEESLMLARLDDVELIDYLKYIFKTEKQALYYHNHANIIRTDCWDIKDYDYNEENFYKAYDECVKLFKGEE